MNASAKSGVSRYTFLSIGVLLAFLAILPVIAQSQTLGQSSHLAANAAGGGLEIVADITGAEVVSVDIAGPGIGVVHSESKESPLWLPTSELTDGSHRFEVQLVDAGTGKIVDRLAGVFMVRKGQVVMPVQKRDKRTGGLLPAFSKGLKSFAGSVCTFFIPEAEASDVTAFNANQASVLFDVTNAGTQVSLNVDWDVDAFSCGSTNGTCFDIFSRTSGHVMRFYDSPNAYESLDVLDSGAMAFANNGMLFDRVNSRLGINNTAPSFTIDAVGTSQIMLRESTLFTAKSISLRNDGVATDLQSQNSDLWIRADVPAPAHNIYMLSNGVGVGTIAPDSKLHVIGQTPPQFIVQNDAGNARMDFRRSSATGVSQLLFGTGPLTGGTMDYQIGMFLDMTFQIRVTNNSTKGIALTTGGNVGIGKTAPVAKLDVAGVVNASGGYSSISDARLKDNIGPIRNALEKVVQTEGVTFTWKKEQKREREGFLRERTME